MQAPRLEVTHLSRCFGTTQAVSDVSLSLQPGQVTCLLGPSGCGKSTTLRMIAGVELPDAGSIKIDGVEVCGPTASKPPEAREIGMMFQDFALFPHMTVAKNIAYGLRLSRAKKTARVAELLARVNLTEHAHKMPHELSGGEQQRVALARAIAPGPKVMLMDEPFSGLDDRLRDQVRDETVDLLREEGTAILMVTHDPHEAMRMADEIALMRGGKIVQTGSPYTIYNAPNDRKAAAFFSDINVIEGVVDESTVQTPFGLFLAPGHTDGALVDVIIRPQHLRIEFDRAGVGPSPTPEMGDAARAKVTRARFLGLFSLIDFEMENGQKLTASLPSVFLPKPGTPFWLIAPRRYCYVLPRGGSSRSK